MCAPCLTLNNSFTSCAGASDCAVPCANNFVVGLNGFLQQRVAIDMKSTHDLAVYDHFSNVSDFTVSMWFNTGLLNRTQYLASKDDSWYIRLEFCKPGRCSRSSIHAILFVQLGAHRHHK